MGPYWINVDMSTEQETSGVQQSECKTVTVEEESGRGQRGAGVGEMWVESKPPSVPDFAVKDSAEKMDGVCPLCWGMAKTVTSPSSPSLNQKGHEAWAQVSRLDLLFIIIHSLIHRSPCVQSRRADHEVGEILLLQNSPLDSDSNRDSSSYSKNIFPKNQYCMFTETLWCIAQREITGAGLTGGYSYIMMRGEWASAAFVLCVLCWVSTAAAGVQLLLALLVGKSLCFVLQVTYFAFLEAPLFLLSTGLRRKKKQKKFFISSFTLRWMFYFITYANREGENQHTAAASLAVMILTEGMKSWFNLPARAAMEAIRRLGMSDTSLSASPHFTTSARCELK